MSDMMMGPIAGRPMGPQAPTIGSVTPRAARIGGAAGADTAGNVSRADAAGQTVGANFGDMLFDSLQGVSNLEQEHGSLAVQAVLNPEEVDAHDVTIAAAQANMALSITKNVVDQVIQAYRDITNLR